MRYDRTPTSFIRDCLDLLGPTCNVCASHLGMAFRGWTGDVQLTDAAAYEIVCSAVPAGTLSITWLAGSMWVEGAQLSPIGEDLMQEGLLLHLSTSGAK